VRLINRRPKLQAIESEFDSALDARLFYRSDISNSHKPPFCSWGISVFVARWRRITFDTDTLACPSLWRPFGTLLLLKANESGEINLVGTLHVQCAEDQ
jgi:hypothetical protein